MANEACDLLLLKGHVVRGQQGHEAVPQLARAPVRAVAGRLGDELELTPDVPAVHRDAVFAPEHMRDVPSPLAGREAFRLPGRVQFLQNAKTLLEDLEDAAGSSC
ncbi:hypothetical protein GCM10009850_107170 [Nonomuraea monospora]|uniref:Uncharacterized protein n=1 Tax=Nonomuraea monospora TaxID=568818 RepID=A0ABP5PU38_9ACTN